LVSYNEKHKEANGEDNRDGESNNRPWNCGVEGPTDDPKVNALRNRQNATFYPHSFYPKASRCFSAEMKLAAPKGQQQRLLSGQRDFLVRLELGGYVTRIRAPAYSAAQRASGVRASGFKAAPFTAQKSRTSAGSPVRFSAVRSS